MPGQHIEERLLREIRDEVAGREPVVSLYIDLDPSEFPTPDTRATQLKSLINETRRGHPETRELCKRIEDASTGWNFDDARSLAVFAAPDWLRVIKLPDPVRPQSSVGDVPLLEPMTEMMDRETWVVWLVNRKAARLMIGTPDRLDEVDDLEDLVHGKHSQGGWSQARYQRSVEQDVDNHLKHAAERLTALRTLRRFDSIVIGTEDEMRMRVLEALPAELKDRVAGTIDVDIENSKPEDIVAKVRDLAERIDAQRERKAIEKLAELLGKSGRAREGIAGVMFALNEHAVDTLLYDPKARPSGTHCPSCGVLDPQAAECPIDGTTMARHENILDVVIDTTVAQSGDPLPIRHHLLDVKDGIAALTRF